jgi:outer membrane protein assembly factor BamB
MTASGWASLASDDESAYVAFNTQVFAINLANGTERWRFPSEPDPKISFYAAPTLTADGALIVGGYDNVLYRVDKQTGQGTPFFEEAKGRFIGSALVTSELVLAPSADHFLYAVDLNGRKVWQQGTSEPLWAKPATDPDCACIYLTSMDHKVYAYEIDTGRLLWSSPDLGGAIVGTPAVSEDKVVYVGTFANEMVALEAATGAEIWRFQANDWVWGGPAIGEDLLYFGDLSGGFYALERETGAVRWQIQPGGAIVGTPLVTPDGIYFTTEDGSLVCVNPEGTIRWNQPLADSLHAGPVAAGDDILVATSNPENLLIAVDSNGIKKWSFGLEK